MGDVIALVVGSRQAVVVFPGQVDDLKIFGGKERGGFEKKLVDAAGALASAGDKNRGPRGIEIEQLESLFARDGAAEVFSNRRACDDARGTGETGSAVLESEKNPRGEFCRKPVGPAGNRIRFVNETRQSRHFRRQNRSRGSEAAHAKHYSGPVFPVNRTTVAVALPEALQETEERRRDQHRRHSDRGEFFGAELGMGLERGRVDLLLGNKEQNLVSPRVQSLGHGEAWKQVSTRPSTSNDGLERFHTRGSICGRSSTGANRETSGCPWRWMLTRSPIRKRQTTRFEPP